MVQKEIAERIVARDGKESILSISVKVYGTPRLAQKSPPAISRLSRKWIRDLAITGIVSPFKNRAEETRFFDVLR